MAPAAFASDLVACSLGGSVMNKAASAGGLGLAQNPTAPRISKRIKIEIKKDYEKIKKISVWSNTLWKEICN
jgi:hypothetical protein